MGEKTVRNENGKFFQKIIGYTKVSIYICTIKLITMKNLKEVKEHFKNTKVVFCPINNQNCNIEGGTITKGYRNFWINGRNEKNNLVSVLLCSESNFSEIIEYKTEINSACKYEGGQIVYNFPKISDDQKWKVIGYIKGKQARATALNFEDFKTVQFVGQSGDYYHAIGDGSIVLVLSIIIKKS